MSRRTQFMALVAVAVLAGCTERTSPNPIPDQPADAPLARAAGPSAAARERLARRLALALGNPEFRARLKQQLDRSPVRERKVHFQRFLDAADRRAARELARSGREPDTAVEADVRLAPGLELYLPVPSHRLAWQGGDDILVATAETDGEPPVAFTPAGRRLILDPRTPPATPVLALVPIETDFDRPDVAQFQGGNTGGGSTMPAGLYMTNAHFNETFEGWLKGSPEFEVHLLGQAGSSDSLQSYSCAGEHAGGYYKFDQNNLDWAGKVLLITQAQINSYKAAHPTSNMRVFVIEDDDTACQIKTDVNRFGALVKAVEAAYPALAGGRDSTGSNLQRWWKRANALQKLIKAIAGVIVTNDELVGNAVESSVVGVSYPNANWVVKGENNKTNGWINLIMQ